MKNRYDVVSLGELLIDFTENGISSQGNPMFEANPGGAVCNVLALLAKFGYRTGFIGKVGADMFGRQLEAALLEVGISTEGLVFDAKVPTTLAFVHTAPDGDRDFSFYRDPGADMMLRPSEVVTEMIKGARIFHIGSLSMTSQTYFEATKLGVDCAKENGVLISFDPNLREPLWDSLDHAREMIAYGLSVADIVKISDNEIAWFTGISDYKEAAAALRAQYPNISLLLVSLGKDGSLAFSAEASAFCPAVLTPNTIETTGAGDTFCGSVLHFILQNGLRAFSRDELAEMLSFANRAASIVTTRRGALRVMPTLEELSN